MNLWRNIFCICRQNKQRNEWPAYSLGLMPTILVKSVEMISNFPPPPTQCWSIEIKSQNFLTFQQNNSLSGTNIESGEYKIISGISYILLSLLRLGGEKASVSQGSLYEAHYNQSSVAAVRSTHSVLSIAHLAPYVCSI